MDTLCPSLIFPGGVHSPENLEALEKSAHRLRLSGKEFFKDVLHRSPDLSI